MEFDANSPLFVVVIAVLLLGSMLFFLTVGTNITDKMWVVFFLLLGGAVLFIFGFFTLSRKRLIQNTPTSKIRSIAMGLVEVYGEVVPSKENVLKSPLTGKSCVYYKYDIQELRSTGKQSSWITIDGGTDMAEFFLKDDTGLVLVDPNGASIDVRPDFSYQTGMMRSEPPKQVLNFLQSRGIAHEGLLGINKGMKFAEYVIEPKDKLYVLGTAGDNPFVEEATGKESTADIMIQKGGKVYLISDKSEKEVLKGMTLGVGAGLLLGPLLIVIGLALLLF
jgi:hypothetical protein